MQRIFRAVTGQEQNSETLPGYLNYTDGTIAGAETGFPVEYTSSGAALNPTASGLESPSQALLRIKGKYRDIFS